MIALIIALLSVLLPLVHLVISGVPRTRTRVVYLLLLYAFVLDVGVIGLFFGFIPPRILCRWSGFGCPEIREDGLARSRDDGRTLINIWVGSQA
jgi:hypothetical protein